MGTKDSKAKEYISDNARFCDLCNYVLYDGRRVIRPQDLKEKDTTEVLSVFGIDKRQIIQQKWRDILKNVTIKYTGSLYVMLIGVENQTEIHYAMPVKNMLYDALSYSKQVNDIKKAHKNDKDYKDSAEFLSGFTKNDRLVPVITITLYLGLDEWDGPRCLVDMMGELEPEVAKLIPDYNINLIDPHEITDFTKFHTELRLLLEILKNASDRSSLDKVIDSDEAFKSVDIETVAAINLFAGTDIKIEKNEEVVNMCKAWEEQKMCGRMEGRIEGAVLFARKLNMDDEMIVKSIMEEFGITKDKAEKYVLTTV